MPAQPHASQDTCRRLASLVPSVLAIQVETVTDTATRTLARALENIAESLLAWHDSLIAGTHVPARAAVPQPDEGPSEFRRINDDRTVIDELAACVPVLRRSSTSLARIVSEVPAEERPGGEAIARALQTVSEEIVRHVDTLRGAQPDVPGGLATIGDLRAATVARSERLLHRRLLATLPG